MTSVSPKVGETRYDEVYAEHARDELRKFLSDKTQDEAAEKLGMHQTTISRNLRIDRQPSFLILIRLAKATRRTIDEIIGLYTVAPPPPSISDSAVMRIAKATAEELARKLPSVPPPPPVPAIPPPPPSKGNPRKRDRKTPRK